MPEIFDVALHFDDIPMYDAYTAAYLFDGQFSSFLEASPDGSTSQRRTLSLSPALTLPARGVILAVGETYLVGYGTVDSIFGEAIRRAYWMKRVTDNFQILTPGQAALNQAGTTAYGHKEYLKDTVNGVTDAEYDPFWDIYFSQAEAVSKGSILKSGSTYYRARTVHVGQEGLIDAGSDELDPASFVSVSFTETGAFNPVLDTTSGPVVNTTGILLDRYKFYEQRTEADPKNLAGDMTLIVAASAVTPEAGKHLEIAGRRWVIRTVTPEQDAYALHIRRA